MASIPLFSAEVDLFETPDVGLRFECLQPHAVPITKSLTGAGLTCSQPRQTIAGIGNLPSLLEVTVQNGTFEEMKAAVLSCLHAAGVTVVEENFSALAGC